jgi:hypothetical protein
MLELAEIVVVALAVIEMPVIAEISTALLHALLNRLYSSRVA